MDRQVDHRIYRLIRVAVSDYKFLFLNSGICVRREIQRYFPARRCSRRCAVMVPCFQSPPATHSLVHIPSRYHQDKCNVDDGHHDDNDGDDDGYDDHRHRHTHLFTSHHLITKINVMLMIVMTILMMLMVLMMKLKAA